MSFIKNQANSTQFLKQLNRECRLYFLGVTLSGISQGIFAVVFNLYILSLGISTETLGGILSVAPLAQMLGSIPVGFIMENIGYKKTFILVYAISGLSKILQVASPSTTVIAATAFIGGLAISGDFVVRLPFLVANTTPEERTKVFSFSSILFSITMAFGSLLAGYVPNLFTWSGMDNKTAYQLLLFLAGILSLAGTLPILKLKAPPIPDIRHKITLAPYFFGMDRFTVQQAVVSLFVGISLGLTAPFMNIYFLFHLGVSRDFFGVISAVAIIPALLATALAPLLDKKAGSVRAVTILRFVIPIFIINFALTTAVWSGTISYWMMNAMNTAAQPLSFAFALWAASKSAKAATAAWLNVTFWLGMAVTAPIAGYFLDKSNFQTPLFMSAAAIIIAAICNDLFFKRIELNKTELVT
ncbi:MAG: MFS transporter [Chloroflexota bacterium]